MQDDAVDGEELMVPRVPNLPPEPSTCSVQKLVSPPRCVELSRTHIPLEKKENLPEIGVDYGFFGRDGEDVLPILCAKYRNSSTECLGATVVDRKGASDCASSFLNAFIKSFGFRRILVKSDNERSLLSLIERVMNN